MRRLADYGLAEGAETPGGFAAGEGLVGQCVRERNVVTLSGLPPEYLQIASGLGQAVPRAAVAWPLLSQDALLGVLEHASFSGLRPRAQALLDAVRARVGLPSVPVSLAAIKAERRLELAGEGHRFFDLVRWGDAAAKLGSRGFVANKQEVFPIPEREIRGTLVVQNQGY